VSRPAQPHDIAVTICCLLSIRSAHCDRLPLFAGAIAAELETHDTRIA
jgi:hypothetical protein